MARWLKKRASRPPKSRWVLIWHDGEPELVSRCLRGGAWDFFWHDDASEVDWSKVSHFSEIFPPKERTRKARAMEELDKMFQQQLLAVLENSKHMAEPVLFLSDERQKSRAKSVLEETGQFRCEIVGEGVKVTRL